ncbi:nuclear inhibitor of protein phosphatase 1 isoform X1 [Notamacropus eugenii]|uniref:nuclear inhibitor of protein phosphatase 1 isoform X1 n=2 Tax=Notamacropus eugenii TaxID=9315 RepID=UPI003B67D347
MRSRRPRYLVFEMGGSISDGAGGGGAWTAGISLLASPPQLSPPTSRHALGSPNGRGRRKMAAAANSGSSLPLFDCPTWAGKPPPGLHLDVVKGDKLIEKLIIDEKKYYLFGRNPDLCDFTIDHQSCSRVHAALVYHKHLKRVFLIDLNSTHGTFLGHIRLEPHKPQQIPIDSTVSFGASTRAYTLREKPQTLPSAVKGDEKMGGEDDELKGLLGLPEEETELDNLTEFNTAHNKRISTLTIEEGNLDIQRPKRKRKNSRVTFSEDDEIINPEDVDPSVGRFRNMVQTAVVPVKKKRVEGPGSLSLEESVSRRMQNFPFSGGLYGGLPPTHSEAGSQSHGIHGTALIGGLPMPYPNLAPEVDLTPVVPSAVNMNPTPNPAVYNPEAVNEPKKKKYAKEAWPGKKPTPSLLI